MNKIYILFISSLFIIPGFLTVHGLQNGVQEFTPTNNTSSQNILEQVASDYQHGIKFRDVLPVAIGILAFGYFIWKSGKVLSKREVFLSKNKYTSEGVKISPVKRKTIYAVKYLVIFPIILYGWVVVCFFFMYALNTSLKLWNIGLNHGGNNYGSKNCGTLE